MRKKTKDEYIIEFNKYHKFKYDYSLMIYVNNSTKIKIICPEHGIFEQRPNDHRKSGCYKCKTIQLSEFIKRSKNIHNDKYDYSMISHIKNNKDKIEIICKNHGIFTQRVDTHLSGKGCKKCADESYVIGVKKFIENSKTIHNNIYDYSIVHEDYINQGSKINIICKKHGIFNQIASNHTNGNGCPTCKRDTKGQKIIRKYLNDKKLNFEEQKNFKNCVHKKYLYFDFYLPDYKCCIEFDGVQHFKPVEYFGGEETFNETIIRDKIKNEYCLNNNIHLFRIKYNDDIELVLEDISRLIS
jgi:very-short-patch-repair endonuclease